MKKWNFKEFQKEQLDALKNKKHPLDFGHEYDIKYFGANAKMYDIIDAYGIDELKTKLSQANQKILFKYLEYDKKMY